MSKPRPVFQCPLCGALAPLSALSADTHGVEMRCAKCENAVRYKFFSDDHGTQSQTANHAAHDDNRQNSPPAERSDLPNSVIDDDVKDLSLVQQKRMDIGYNIEGLDEALQQDYRQAVRAGDGLAAHQAMIKRAAVLNQLKQVGSIYKQRLELDSDDALAQACQQQIIALAVANLKPQTLSSSPATDKTRQALIITLSLIVTVAAIAWMLHQGLL